MTFKELISIPFENIYNEIDDGVIEDLNDLGIDTKIAGFSEWKSKQEPYVSLGFTFFSAAEGDVHVSPEPLRGNVMLVDRMGYDLGPKNNSLLRLWLDFFSWKPGIKTAMQCA